MYRKDALLLIMKPDRIIIVRHGESEGNVNKEIYKDVTDYALQLTSKGVQQATAVGKEIHSLVGDTSCQFYVSPFWRTRQTYLYIARHFPIECVNFYEDSRLREQEWGQDLVSREGYSHERENDRDAYGHYYYRFRDGESCADVYDRVSDFMGTMYRDFKKEEFPRTCVIVTHGMTMRLFLMRFFHASVEEFETWSNPKNCGYFLLERNNKGKYVMKTKLRKHKIKHKFQFPCAAEDRKYFKYPHKFDYEPESR